MRTILKVFHNKEAADRARDEDLAGSSLKNDYGILRGPGIAIIHRGWRDVNEFFLNGRRFDEIEGMHLLSLRVRMMARGRIKK